MGQTRKGTLLMVVQSYRSLSCTPKSGRRLLSQPTKGEATDPRSHGGKPRQRAKPPEGREERREGQGGLGPSNLLLLISL